MNYDLIFVVKFVFLGGHCTCTNVTKACLLRSVIVETHFTTQANIVLSNCY